MLSDVVVVEYHDDRGPMPPTDERYDDIAADERKARDRSGASEAIIAKEAGIFIEP